MRRQVAASLLCASAIALGPGLALAAPMGFKGSVMAMGDFGPNWRESWANYALTSRDAFGAGGLYMRSDDETRTRTLAEVNYTRLLQRWNLEDAQANVWLFAGIGSIRGNDFSGSKFAYAPGVQVDYDEVQPWLVVEARRMRGLSDKTEITPMLRLIHNRYFVELGVNTARQARANFMYVF